MAKNIKIFLGILLLGAVLVVFWQWYPKYQEKTAQQAVSLQQKTTELEQLVFAPESECEKVIREAGKQATGRILELKAICQFDLGRFDEARASFQKVLNENPDSETAKSYLKQLDFRPGEVVVAAAEIPIDESNFQEKIGLKIGGSLKFEQAVKRPSNIPEYLMATYSSQTTHKDTVEYLKGILTEAGSDHQVLETKEGTVLIFNSPKEQKFFTVFKDTDPVKIEVKYLQLE